MLGNTFCANLLKQFLSAAEDSHEPITSLGKATELSFQRCWKMREGSNGRALLAPSLAQKCSPGLQQSRTHSGSSGCSGGRLRLPVDMLSSWLAMALMLVSATTWATGMQETQCGTAVVEFSPQTGFKTKPCCLKSPLIPVSGKSSHFVGPQCRFCSEASSCPHKRITRALSKGEEFFWLIRGKGCFSKERESA